MSSGGGSPAAAAAVAAAPSGIDPSSHSRVRGQTRAQGAMGRVTASRRQHLQSPFGGRLSGRAPCLRSSPRPVEPLEYLRILGRRKALVALAVIVGVVAGWVIRASGTGHKAAQGPAPPK